MIAVFLLAAQWLHAQSTEDIVAYIGAYKDLAVIEEQRNGVPASITLAQGIHETMAGKSDLVLKSNNHFGIKCKDNWNGDKVYHDDDAHQECFRSYPSAAESYSDHSRFLKSAPRYAFLFALDPEDYKGWAYGLKKAGYATNIRYSQILIKLIEDYNLQQYTLVALGKLQTPDDILAEAGKPSDANVIVAGGPREPAAPSTQYPADEFSINNPRVVFAKAGTSMLGLAQKYDVGLGRLLDFNDLGRNEDVLIRDQLIFLQRKRKTGAAETHVVKKGELLYDICQAEGMRLEALRKLNRLDMGEEPAPGEKLYLQSKASARPKLASEMAMTVPPTVNTNGPLQARPDNPVSAVTHTVQ